MTEFYGTCNCERRKLHDAEDHAVRTYGVGQTTPFPFALSFFELHTLHWCTVVNSAGGMFQLKYGDQ